MQSYKGPEGYRYRVTPLKLNTYATDQAWSGKARTKNIGIIPFHRVPLH